MAGAGSADTVIHIQSTYTLQLSIQSLVLIKFYRQQQRKTKRKKTHTQPKRKIKTDSFGRTQKKNINLIIDKLSGDFGNIIK